MDHAYRFFYSQFFFLWYSFGVIWYMALNSRVSARRSGKPDSMAMSMVDFSVWDSS